MCILSESKGFNSLENIYLTAMGSGISVVGNGLSEDAAVSALVANLLDARYGVPEKYDDVESFRFGSGWRVEIIGYGFYEVVMTEDVTHNGRFYIASLKYIEIPTYSMIF